MRTLIILWISSVLPACGLQVESARWGFNGKVVAERVNVLNVLVYNDTGQASNGDLQLVQTSGIGRIDAILARADYLGPGQRRWVQFTPYVGTHSSGNWQLRWGRDGRDRHQLSAPDVGARAVVVLQPRAVQPGRRKLPGYAENLFPPTVCATDALAGVVLGHMPEWEPTREAAFLDWLFRGGVVHLAETDGGVPLRFEGALALLNQPGARFRHGNGHIVRHRVRVSELTPALLAASGFRIPGTSQQPLKQNYSMRNSSQNLFRLLGSCVSPQHNWTLIYILAGLYLILIAPVNYLIGRKAKRHWLSLGFFLALVTVFSIIMSVIGRKGYGTESRTFAVGYARDLGNGRADVTQWATAFVAKRNRYKIVSDAQQSILSAAQPNESVDGVIRNGPKAEFDVEIPVYSKRQFLHRGVWELATPVVSVQGGTYTVKSDLELLDVILWQGGKLQRTSKNGNIFSGARAIDYYGHTRIANGKDVTEIPHLELLAVAVDGLEISGQREELPPLTDGQQHVFVSVLAPDSLSPARTFGDYRGVITFHCIAQVAGDVEE